MYRPIKRRKPSEVSCGEVASFVEAEPNTATQDTKGTCQSPADRHNIGFFSDLLNVHQDMSSLNCTWGFGDPATITTAIGADYGVTWHGNCDKFSSHHASISQLSSSPLTPYSTMLEPNFDSRQNESSAIQSGFRITVNPILHDPIPILLNQDVSSDLSSEIFENVDLVDRHGLDDASNLWTLDGKQTCFLRCPCHILFKVVSYNTSIEGDWLGGAPYQGEDPHLNNVTAFLTEPHIGGATTYEEANLGAVATFLPHTHISVIQPSSPTTHIIRELATNPRLHGETAKKAYRQIRPNCHGRGQTGVLKILYCNSSY